MAAKTYRVTGLGLVLKDGTELATGDTFTRTLGRDERWLLTDGHITEIAEDD